MYVNISLSLSLNDFCDVCRLKKKKKKEEEA